MKIITPHKKVAAKVSSYKEIALEADEMRELVNGSFQQGLWKSAFAISHAQVSEKPKRFFVVHQDLKKAFNGYDVIINPRIVDAAEKEVFKEACMSYPFRSEKKMHRYFKVFLAFKARSIFGLKSVNVMLEGIPAQVAQHEIDHANGRCIYD